VLLLKKGKKKVLLAWFLVAASRYRAFCVVSEGLESDVP